MTLLIFSCLLLCVTASAVPTGSDYVRLYHGVVYFVDNADGKALDFRLELRSWHIFAGPREVLIKVYDPQGTLIHREVIDDDDAPPQQAYGEAIAGWDHENWYYVSCKLRGIKPMVRWSAFSEPARVVSTLRSRVFSRAIPAHGKGLYRVLLVGAPDHVVRLTFANAFPYAISPFKDWIHGHDDLYRTSYVYIPPGSTRLDMLATEYDEPTTRTITLSTLDGKTLAELTPTGGFAKVENIDPVKLGIVGSVVRVEVTPGANAYLLALMIYNSNLQVSTDPRLYCEPAIFAPTPELARKVHGGLFMSNGRLFHHPFQAKLYAYLLALKPADFRVLGPDGKPATLPEKPGFVGVNGPHELSPSLSEASQNIEEIYAGLQDKADIQTFIDKALGGHALQRSGDRIMYSYPLHKSKAELNLAMLSLYQQTLNVGAGDHGASTGWWSNMAYTFATYSMHHWRQAWRMMQDPDVPAALKPLLKEMYLLMGDSLAFTRGIERGNGNAFAHMPVALSYCAAVTQDPLQIKLKDQCFQRMFNEGWGKGTGMSPSGIMQEHFSNDNGYGTYSKNQYRVVVADLGEPMAKKILDLQTEYFRHTMIARYDKSLIGPTVWNGRVKQNYWIYSGLDYQENTPYCDTEQQFTRSVNGGNEFFAAKRKGYYALVYAGRLAPIWLDDYWDTSMNYGGGTLALLYIPLLGPCMLGQGGGYGEGMELSNWRNFQFHGVVGALMDGRPLVSDDCEPVNKLAGNVLTISGQLRSAPVSVQRRYEFGDETIACTVSLGDALYRAAFLGGSGPSSKLNSAYEAFPIGETAQALDKDGAVIGPVGKVPTPAFGIRLCNSVYASADTNNTPNTADRVTGRLAAVDIRWHDAKPVLLNDSGKSVWVQLIDKPSDPQEVSFQYELRPFTLNEAGQ